MHECKNLLCVLVVAPSRATCACDSILKLVDGAIGCLKGTRRTTGISPFHAPCEPRVAEAYERGLIWAVPPQGQRLFEETTEKF